MDLLERSSALDELGGLLAAAAAGGRVVLVAGEAGIGKSALVRGFAERHAADVRFLAGGCDPLLTPRALGPLHYIARQTGGRLAELLASGEPREAVFAAFLDELVQSPRRQVVVVEDAHWADEATLDLLVFLERRLERTRALLIVTYRDDELGADHPLRGVLGVLPHGVVHRVRLRPLSGAAVAQLAQRAGRAAAGLRALTGGNPLLVTEVLAAGAFELAVRAGHPWFAGELASWLWRAGALPEVPAVAAEPYRLLLAGDWQAAASAWQALGCPYEQAQALAHGDTEACLQALRLLDGLGATQTAQRLRRQLRARGSLSIPRGPIRATAANPAGLTGRQLEVLRLLAAGQSNAEIAARLSLSVKTVDHHVSALLAKLAVGSRRQAAAAARRLGIALPRNGEPGDPS